VQRLGWQHELAGFGRGGRVVTDTLQPNSYGALAAFGSGACSEYPMMRRCR
jgi:hypothetical protein